MKVQEAVFYYRAYKAWHYASAVKVDHFERITMFIGAMAETPPTEFYLKHTAIP